MQFVFVFIFKVKIHTFRFTPSTFLKLIRNWWLIFDRFQNSNSSKNRNMKKNQVFVLGLPSSVLLSLHMDLFVCVQARPRNLASTVKAFEKKILLWKAETVTTAASQIHLDLVKFTCVKNHKKIVSNSLEICHHNKWFKLSGKTILFFLPFEDCNI